MANALTCGKCGNEIASDRLKLEFGGNCPWCLASFALGDPPSPAAPASGAFESVGKYVLTEKLGTGGMGEVWKALDTELNRQVALKFLKDPDPKEAARFAREAHMSAKLSHPNIAAVHEIGEAAGRRYIAMQCVEGRTLENFRTNDRRLLVRLCMDAAKALDHAHRHGVIHRDVKPGNLMVEETEDGMKVVVLDFGLARAIEGGEKLSKSGSIVGTPHYLSPEQARAEKLDERTDVYSLGATMYEIFTGKAPFEGENVYEILRKIENEEPVAPRTLKPQINPDLQTIILKCLEKKRDRRYDSAKDLANDLRRFLNHEAILARPPSAIYRLRMKLARRKSIVAAVAAALILAVGVPVVLTKFTAEARARERLVDYQKAYNEGRNVWDEVLQMIGRADLDRTKEKVRLARGHFERAIEIQEHADAHVMRGRCLQMERKRAEAQAAWERALELEPGNQEARFHLAKLLLLRTYYDRNLSYITSLGKSGEPQLWIRLGPENQDLRRRAEKLLAGVDRDEKSVYLRGILKLAQGDFKEGARLLALYNHEGWDVVALGLEGQARQFSSDVEGALRAYDRAIDLDPKSPTSYVNRGTAKYDKGLLDDAIKDFDRAIELDPKEATPWSNRGNAKSRKGQFDEAIADCNEAIKREPNYSTAHVNRAVAKTSRGDLEGAIKDFTLAIKFDKNCSEAYAGRGSAKAAQQKIDEALADFDKAIEIGPPRAETHYSRGLANAARDRYADAIADYANAIEIDKSLALAWIGRGNALEHEGREKEAIENLQEAIRLDPKSAHAHFSLGHVKDHLGLREEAIEHYKKAIAQDPKFAPAHLHHGTALLHKGQVDEAIKSLDEAITLDDKVALAFANRGSARAQKNLHQLALDDLTKAIDLDPLNAAIPLANRSLIYQGLGRFEEAIEDATKATLLDPKYAHGHNTLGLAMQSKGAHKEAIPHFTKSIELDGKDATAWNNLGFSLLSVGSHDEAIKACMKAIELEPALAMPYNNLGLAKYRKGQFEEAIEALTTATERDPKLWWAYLNRGLAKSAQGFHDKAIEDYEAAIQGDPTSAHFHRGRARCAQGLIDQAIGDWQEALRVASPGWPYRAAVEELISTRGLRVIFEEALRLRGVKKFREAIEKYKGIVDSHPKTPQAVRAAYNIGCGYAHLGEKKNALDWLEKAVKMGWDDLDHLETDSDLESLRSEARFKKLAETLRAK